MTNFAVVFVFAAFICATYVHVYADDGDNDKNGGGSSSSFENWMKDHKFDDPETDMKFPHIHQPDVQDVYNLKPQDNNTKVSASYSDYSSNVEMKDGKVVHQSESSKKVDNDNGKITEVDKKN